MLNNCDQMSFITCKGQLLYIKPQYYLFLRLPNEKLYTIDSDQDAILVLRAIGSIKQKPIYLRDYRAHLMAEAVSYELDNEQVGLFLNAYSLFLPTANEPAGR